MRLNFLQKLLERLYGIEIGQAVEDFLITDPELADRLDTSPNSRNSQEKLLVAQHDEELRLALFLDAGVMGRLTENNPLDRLHGENFGDFLLALEGVSHFLYLVWKAHCRRGVSLLELEMQAEVDKFVLTTALWRRQGRRLAPAEIRGYLFDAPRYDAALDQEQRRRYEDASRFAGKYCQRIEHRYLRQRRDAEMMRELRRFYRLSQYEKIRLIDSAA